MNKIGVWIIGIYGSISSLAIGSAKLLSKGIIPTTGLLTELPDLKHIDLLPFSQMVFGGHDIYDGNLIESFSKIGEIAHINQTLLEEWDKTIFNGFNDVEKNICHGTRIGSSEFISGLADKSLDDASISLTDITNQLIRDINNFKNKHNLKTVIVINLSSTEPPALDGAYAGSLHEFDKAIEENRKDLIRASMLYAYAAFKNDCPFVNFTPSAGASIPALKELAHKQKLPYAGNDGKTGETLIKSVLALLFKYRVMKVLTWQSYNILGNSDGKVLAEPEACLSKKKSKDGVLSTILGYKPHTYIGIDYVPSLSDWKVAWDYIHFEGFLGTKMSMQFTWQGCDSILAAPLVLDLIRLVELAHRRGETGPLIPLALFFKQPVGTDIADLPGQWNILWNFLNKEKDA